MGTKDSKEPVDSVEVSVEVSPASGVAGKMRVGHLRSLISLISPRHVARVELIEAAAAGVGTKIREGNWDKITDEERALAGIILQDRADAFTRRVEIAERAEEVYDEVKNFCQMARRMHPTAGRSPRTG